MIIVWTFVGLIGLAVLMVLVFSLAASAGRGDRMGGKATLELLKKEQEKKKNGRME